jgi:hypothetical protein
MRLSLKNRCALCAFYLLIVGKCCVVWISKVHNAQYIMLSYGGTGIDETRLHDLEPPTFQEGGAS